MEQDNKKYLVWDRPKKVGRDARVTLKLSKNIDFEDDLQRFLDEIRSRDKKSNRLYYHALIQRIGESAGIVKLSPMSFRHTLGVSLRRQGVSEVAVMNILNCSRKTVETYTKFSGALKDDELERIDF